MIFRQGVVGKENAEERVEGKGRAQESTKGEGKPNKKAKEDAGDERKPELWNVFNLDGGERASALGSGDVDDPSALDLNSLNLGLAVCPGLPLPHNRTRCLKLDETALRVALTTRQ